MERRHVLGIKCKVWGRLKSFFWLFSLGLTLFVTAPMVHAQETESVTRMFLIFDHQILQLNFKAQPDLLQQAHQHFFRVGEHRYPLQLKGRLVAQSQDFGEVQTEFVTEIAPDKLKNFLEEAAILKPHDPTPVEINLNKWGQVTFEGNPQAGYKIDFGKLISLVNEGLKYGYSHVRVPAEKIYSDVVVHPDLYERGIQEIVAVGESNFRGSSVSRRQNIKAASRKFDGEIVKKGKYFSFNQILEDVNEEDGFVKELVIKGNETKKELGGGVCQVSTTAYRAAINGGFPIKDRRNHSFAVPYYKPFGLDAAIYLGATDMRFKNDTPGDLLVQTMVDRDNLYFVFYGTRDDRKISLEGPFISDIRKPKDPIVLESEDLPSGEMKVISEAHDGFEAQWIRRIEKGGEISKETIYSYYRPWPARVERGSVKPARRTRRFLRESGELGLN